ncbi:glycosyltransferase [Algibacter lectus]|uniref:Glycosyltransferase n=1 Tax=Algibacter lectus TaxID=221126 RepID=A0A090WXF8_9FLAO|nr:glycosyltransferase family A protein [Algibacter lectus]GAL81815.1 glycosyltransferase [Algibacter lectus]
MQSLVSIIIPTYNRLNIIEVALTSVLNQSYHNWECIIVDDRSTDNSFEKVSEYIEHDKRFSILKRPVNSVKGASSCRNIGLFNAKGDYVVFLDSDDCMINTCLENRILEFENNKNSDFLVFPMGGKNQ